MSLRVPEGLIRSKVGNRIVYESTPPGLKVRIWKHKDFDDFKLKGRFPHIERSDLNFSTKLVNAPEGFMEVDLTDTTNASVTEEMNIAETQEKAPPESLLIPGSSTKTPQTGASKSSHSNRKQKPENRIKNQVNDNKMHILIRIIFVLRVFIDHTRFPKILPL